MGRRCLRKRGPVVSTSLGKVEGGLVKTENGRKVYSYRGIPYGCPPLGERRFKKPEPVSAWKHTIDCRREAKKSLQPNVLFPEKHLLAEGGEDCLYLSVFTKAAPGKEPGLLPVVVFLHGGAFLVGSCQADLYGPQVLLDHPFVLVGVNYRLGPLGWLSLGCEEAPGNLGLWDQRLALLWVRDHISAFGGDPSCVTLMGESAGAMSAMLHMVAPPSAGLFHRVVALSGTPSNPLLHLSRKPAAYARSFAKRLGCEEGLDDVEILKFLQSVTAKRILKNQLIFKDWDNAAPMPWVPVDDSHLIEPFLPLSFYEAVKAGKIVNVPVIMGCCKDEGLILSAPFQRYRRQLDILTSDWDTWAPLLFFGRERDLVGDKEAEIVRWDVKWVRQGLIPGR